MRYSGEKQRPIILCVDDEPVNLQALKQILEADYRLLFARDGQRALELVKEEHPSLVLLDAMMPDMNGYQVCAQIKAAPELASIPVIFVTSLDEAEDETYGFEVGAVDYITKPLHPAVVRARVRTHLSLVREEELRSTRLQVIQRLGRAAEYKDNETGFHVIRMSHYARLLALAAGWPEERAEDLFNAAPMHDVGKIGIPDKILRKPGVLDPEEWAIMQTHVEIGMRIIGEQKSGLLALAALIVYTHHEKWDGTGYPRGLRGTDIPIEGRIVAIADVFDALTSPRPYKRPWSIEETSEYLRAQQGKHFDPELVELFFTCLPQAIKVKEEWDDTPFT